MHDEMTTRDVATRLSVSPVTVRRHLSSAVAKMGVGDRDAALALIRDLNVSGTGREDAPEPRPDDDAGVERAQPRP
jgi:predicted ArsR family transcriptional regulator